MEDGEPASANGSGVWRDLRTISVYREHRFQLVKDNKWANDLNYYFNRFDSSSAPLPGLPSLLQLPPSEPPSKCPSYTLSPLHATPTFPVYCPSHLATASSTQLHCFNLSLTKNKVRFELRKIKARKVQVASAHGFSSLVQINCVG